MRLVVGRIVRPHGIHGEVTVEVRTDEPAERFAPESVLATDPPVAGPLVVRSSRRHGDRLVVAFEGLHDRSAAARLRGVSLLVEAAGLPSLGDRDEFRDHELTGLAVVDRRGARIGKVDSVLHPPGQDLLVVRDGAEETLVPFVRAIVPEVDVEGGRLVVDPPPGLFDFPGTT